MFKDTRSLFERRKIFITKTKDKVSLVRGELMRFLKDRLGNDLDEKYISLGYNPKDNSLILNAGNKILANELTFHLADIQEFIKTKGVKLDKILIR